MSFAAGFLVGAVIATAAPFVGAVVGAALYERNERDWLGWWD